MLKIPGHFSGRGSSAKDRFIRDQRSGPAITGLSSEIAQTLVMIGVDLNKMNTIGDLQGGLEEAERLLGFKVSKMYET